MHQTIDAWLASDGDLDGRMAALLRGELATLAQLKFAQPDGQSDPCSSEMRSHIESQFDQVLAGRGLNLAARERQELLDCVIDDILGYGPLEAVLRDPDVTEVMVDGPDRIYVERYGELEDVPGHFRDDEDLLGICYRILTPLRQDLNESNPIADARLPDDSFVNIVMPPISLVGPALTIRKFAKSQITLENLLEWGSITADVVEFLRACFRARLNILVAGGTDSGKTTMLNVLAGMIPAGERIVTIEERAELRLPEHLEHVIRLVGRAPDKEGKGEVSIRDLVLNSLQMRPDRIVFGEVRGTEALDVLQLMDIGVDGTLFTIHANSSHDALTRFETMVLMDDLSLPLSRIREEIASSLDLIVYQERLADGSRKVMNVTEVAGMQGDTVVLQDIFEFRQTGDRGQGGQIQGHLTATGAVPRFLSHFRDAGIDLPLTMFTPHARSSLDSSQGSTLTQGEAIVLGEIQDGKRYETVVQLQMIVDLLVGYVGSGQYGYDQAVELIAEQQDNELTRALEQVNRDLASGVPRVEAMRNMAKGIDVPEVTAFVEAMIEKSIQGGIRIYDALAEQAALLRKQTRAT
jgi:pilus assembly protein CpaF